MSLYAYVFTVWGGGDRKARCIDRWITHDLEGTPMQSVF